MYDQILTKTYPFPSLYGNKSSQKGGGRWGGVKKEERGITRFLTTLGKKRNIVDRLEQLVRPVLEELDQL